MSGVTRSNSSTNRRAARRHAALPYSRPAPKKSSWAWSDLFSLINPLRALSPSRHEEEREQETSAPVQSSAAHTLSSRGREMMTQEVDLLESSDDEQRPANNTPAPATLNNKHASDEQLSPDQQSPASLLENLTSQGTNSKAVEDFLRSKGDQPLTRIEYAGVLALLSGRVEAGPEEKEAPFKFSTASLSPEPAQATFTPGSASNGGRKMLLKNPNGPYVLRGGGSARPRNRYQSPGFGPPQRLTTPIRINPDKPPADGKRRRIGFDPDLRPVSSGSSTSVTNGYTPVAGPSSAGPSGVSVINGPSKVNGTSPTTPIRRRTVLPAKPTTPVNPSPLRQTWGQPDSPPSQSSPPSAGKQTQSAAYLYQLIKEISPKKNPDIQNPYQTASVLPPRPATKKPPQRKPRGAEASKAAPKPTAAAAPPAEEPPLTSVEAIEATMPTGSKRARPLPNFRPVQNGTQPTSVSGASSATPNALSLPRRAPRAEANVGPTSNGLSANVSITYQEISEEEESPQKRQKTTAISKPTLNGRNRARPSSVEIEEVPDEGGPGRAQDYTLPSEVIEPDDSSKLSARDASPATSGPVRVGLPTSSQDRFRKFAPTRPSSLRNQVSIMDKEDVAESVPIQPVSKPTMPSFVPTAKPSTPSFAPVAKRSAPPFVPTAKPNMPSFAPVAKPSAKNSQPPSPKDPKTVVAAKEVSDLPTFTLTVPTTNLDVSQLAKDKVKAMSPAELPTYNFKAALSSPVGGSSTSSGIAPGSAATAGPTSTKGFNWEGAGMKKPVPKPEGSWTCSTCMCTNDASATEKCIVCEAPPPAAPKAQPVGFNWDAAKLAKPKAQEGSWTCSVCMCSNGPEVTEKCSVCEASRPR